MKETVTMPTARVYLDNLRKLLADNSLITEAWFDHPDHPTALHIRHRKTFDLHHCKMSQALASLKLIFHAGPHQATKPRV